MGHKAITMKQWQLHPAEPQAHAEPSQGEGSRDLSSREASGGSGARSLRLVEVEEPVPGPGQVLVRLRAASLNFRDLLILRGQAPARAGRVPLSDGAGEVVAVGPPLRDALDSAPGAGPWEVGARVAGTFFGGWSAGRFEMRFHQAALGGSVDGVLSELALFEPGDLVRLPERFSFEEGAALPCAGVTAWAALARGGFRAGDSVLLQGTGGVSMWGLQIVAASGGRAIVTSSSDAKLARARGMGAWACINYSTEPDWDRAVWKATGKRGVDHILEVGGAGTLGRSLACLAPGGHIALIGVLTGAGAPDASMFPLVAKNARASGIYVGSREDFEALVRFLESAGVRPIIDRAFAFEDAPAAYKYLESGSHLGKVVITI